MPSARRLYRLREFRALPIGQVRTFNDANVLLEFDGWIGRDGEFTPAIVANGLPPPQCLLDYLDGGGNIEAHPASEEWRRDGARDTLLQLATDSDGMQHPRVVELLLQRGANVRGTLSRPSPLANAAS